MARDINIVVLTGRLGGDCEIRHTKTGLVVCKFSLANNWSKKDSGTGAWADMVNFFDCTLFGASGEAFAKYHGKGSKAMVQGELRLDTYTDKDTGKKVRKPYINVDRWTFCGNKPPKERVDVGPEEPPSEHPALAPLDDTGLEPADPTPF